MNDHASPTHSSTTATPGEHPSAETWIAYHAGQLSQSEGEGLQDHLAQCRQCVELVLDLDRFNDPGAATAANVSDFEKAAVWRAFQSSRPTKAPSRWPAAAAVAAALTFATLGVAGWSQHQKTVDQLQTRIAQLSEPQVNTIIRDLDPSARQRSARGADPTAHLPADDRPITLILNLEEPVAYASYELAILDSEGTESHRLTGLEPSEFDNFYINLPSGSLAPGRYELRLFGLADSTDLLEVFPLELEAGEQ